MASRARTPTPSTILLQATRVLLARALPTLLLHQRVGLTRPNAVSHRWASVWALPDRSPQNMQFTPAVGGAYPCMPNRSLRAHRPPGLPHRLILGTSSCQISSVYLGGILVWRVSYALLLLGDTLGSGHSWARSPSQGQHAYNILLYSPNTHYVYRGNICKYEIVKLCFINKVWEEHVRYLGFRVQIRVWISYLVSRVFCNALKALGVAHVVSSAYHPESQGALKLWPKTLKSSPCHFEVWH